MKVSFGNNRRARAWPALVGLLSAAVLAGCAGGPWIESSAEADLPIDMAVSPYPTALDPDAPPVEEPAADRQQEKPPTMPATPLAAVPAHLRQPQAPPKPIAIQQPNASEVISITLPPQSAPAPSQPAAPAAEPAVPSATAAIQPVSVPLGTGPNVVQLLPVHSGQSTVSDRAAKPLSADSAGTAGTLSEDRQATIDRSRTELIAALEAEIRDRRSRSAADDELPRLEQQLRLMYLAADRLDDAVANVESLDEPQREGFKQAMFGLGVWLSPDEARRAPLRTAKVLRSLREATTELAGASKLDLRNLVFCERVEQFGWYTEFPRNEFRPKQQVILYVEVENFAAEKKAPGYETELQGAYQIFDAGGRIVAERQLPLDREMCRNYRRDYFLAYPIYLPDAIEPGRYRLELTIEDLKASGDYQGRKFGEGMIEFTIRQ
jgi:hypothetical protein